MMDICSVALSFSLAAMPMLKDVVVHEPEIIQRSVRVNFAKGTCTGVLVDAKTVKTAGHCFKDGGRFMSITTYDRKSVTARFSTKWEAPPTWAREPRAWDDEAEIKADREIAKVSPVEIVDPATLPKSTSIVMGGFGLNKDSFRLIPVRLGKGRDWKLFWFQDTYAGWSSEFLKPRVGDSGGGAWVIRDGKLALAGVLTRLVLSPDRLGTGTAIQPLAK